MGGFTASLSKNDTVAHVYGRSALQVGQGERGLPIAAIHCPQQGKQRLVLGDGHKLAIAQGPAHGREISSKNPDLCYELI